MADRRTFRQLLLSLLALRNGLGHKEIGARVGLKRWRVATVLGGRRKTEIDDATYEWLLSGVTSRAAASTVMAGCLEALDALDAEADLAEEELAAIEDEVLGAGRLVRGILAAAIRRSRTVPPAEDYPNPFEVSDDPGENQDFLDGLLDERIYVSLRYTSGVGGIRVSTHYFNDESDLEVLLSAVRRLSERRLGRRRADCLKVSR